MHRYEYKIVPAPKRGRKGSGVKGAEGRFANSLEMAINALAEDGWEYLRAELLPSEERQGLTSSQTVYRSVLVFRRGTESSQPASIGVPLGTSLETDIPPALAPASDVANETDAAGSDAPHEVEEGDAQDDPSKDVQERALSSLYSSPDNSKQD